MVTLGHFFKKEKTFAWFAAPTFKFFFFGAFYVEKIHHKKNMTFDYNTHTIPFFFLGFCTRKHGFDNMPFLPGDHFVAQSVFLNF